MLVSQVKSILGGVATTLYVFAFVVLLGRISIDNGEFRNVRIFGLDSGYVLKPSFTFSRVKRGSIWATVSGIYSIGN